MKNSIKLYIPDVFNHLLDVKNRYLIIYGGAGSGKSKFVARKIVYRCLVEGGHKFLVLRKYKNTTRLSVVMEIRKVLEENEIEYKYNKNDNEIRFGNNTIIFLGMDDPEKLKSIEGITGVWMEEATEFEYKDYMQIDLRLRGETKFYKQIIMTFNPVSGKRGDWIKKEFFNNGEEKVKSKDFGKYYIHHSTVDDNPFIDEEYKKKLDDIPDESLKKIYRYGRWSEIKGLIYADNIGYVKDFIKDYDIRMYGMDFGWNNPSVLEEIRIKDDSKVYLKNLIYESYLKTSELIERMNNLGVSKRDLIIGDSAEPDKIEEIKEAGYNIVGAVKKSVYNEIIWIKGKFRIYLLNDDEKSKDNFTNYKWKEKNGEFLDEPVKYKDHIPDAVRYALTYYYKYRDDGFIEMSEDDFY